MPFNLVFLNMSRRKLELKVVKRERGGTVYTGSFNTYLDVVCEAFKPDIADPVLHGPLFHLDEEPELPDKLEKVSSCLQGNRMLSNVETRPDPLLPALRKLFAFVASRDRWFEGLKIHQVEVSQRSAEDDIFFEKKPLKKSPSQKEKEIKKIEKKRKAKEIEGLTKVDEDVQISFDDDFEDVSEEEVVFKNIEPTKKELSKLQIPQKDAIQHERSVDSDDNFQDPPPRKINKHSKKKQKVDSSTLVVKKPLRKKQVDSFDEHTQTRTPSPYAAKTDGTKTPVFKPISTRQASFSKTKKEKQIARVIFPQGGLEQSGQYFSPDAVQSSDNIYDGTKQQHADKDSDLQNMDYVGTERSPQQLSSEVDQKLKANLLNKKGCTDLHSEKMNVEIDSQQLISDELLRSINLDYLHSEKSIIIHPSANRQEESHHEILDAKTSETVIEDHDQMTRGITDSEVELATEEKVNTPRNTQEVTNDEQRDEQLWPDSQNTIPDEFIPSLNVYNQKSIIIHPSANREVKTPRPKLRIRRSSKFKESPYTEKFGSAAGSSAGLIRIFPQKHSFLYHSIDGIIDTKIVKSFKDWISTDLLKATAKSGHYTVVIVEIEKITKIISLCLLACDFYVKKGIDLQNYPRYKDKESSDMFDVLFEDDLPQQPSGSLDCGVFMVMYAECLSYGHKVIATEFDPNALRTRYAVLLWDYGIRK
ncbi:hypothetical protein BC332_15457 [Capsicum chinense]|nr:hypothetical protein BC332_15457 [Capsicum chinense]